MSNRGVWVGAMIALGVCGLGRPAEVKAQDGCIGECCGACSVVNTTGGSGDPCDLDADCTGGETCNGRCGILGGLCTTDVQCAPTGTNGFCISESCAGRFNPAAGGSIIVNGGQVSGAGATLFVPFFRTPSSTNDWNDVNSDGCQGFNNPPCSGGRFVDQLGPLWPIGGNITPWWMFQYRSVGSVNGFEEFVANQTCAAIPLDIPSEAGIFNQFEYATGGVRNWAGAYGNDSGTPVAPREIEFSFLDVPSRWGVKVETGTPKWSRAPLAPGYGRNPTASSSGLVSNLQNLERACGTCSISGDPCTTNVADSRSCPIGETCVPNGTTVTLNQNPVADEDTIFDEVAAVVPVAYAVNRGTGVENLKYSEAQYVMTAGRMPSGENLVGVTRSVGSGTRNAIMNSSSIDTSWGRGDNVGNEDGVTANFRLGPNTQQTNGGGSSQVEEAMQNWRLALGYTGLCGGGRAASDANGGLYEVVNLCKDIAYSECNPSGLPCVSDKDCPGGEFCDEIEPACDCSAKACGAGADGFGGNRQVATPNLGYVRPGLNGLLDNCDPCCGYQIVGNGSFVVRGDRNENRPAALGINPRVDNQAVADYLNNIYDSVASFSGSTQAGNCFFLGTGCTTDANCPGTFCTLAAVATPCVTTGDCAVVDPLSTCEPDFCRLKANMPGDFLAQTFFLPDAVDCTQALTSGVDFDPNTGLSQVLQNFIRTSQNCPEPVAYGTATPAGKVPRRNTFNVKRCSITTTQECEVDGDCPQVPPETCVTVTGLYGDGSSSGSYIYFNGTTFTTIAQGQNLARRNRLQGDMNQDCSRNANDTAELTEAYHLPRKWAQSAEALNAGGGCLGAPSIGNQTTGGLDTAIPEVIADFNGDGDLDKEDLRYFADGLGTSAGQLNRKAGAIAIDNGLNAIGRCAGDVTKVCQVVGDCTAQGTTGPCNLGDRMLPWADTRDSLLVPPAVVGNAPSFNIPADINTMHSTGVTYEPGDFRGDVAGGRPQTCISGKCSVTRHSCTVNANCPESAPTAGAQPMGWDGLIDSQDVNYCCSFVGFDWGLLNDAVFMDLSCDMDGDLDVDGDDIHELTKEILEAADGDADLDGDVDLDDVLIVQGTINDTLSCNQTLTCCWTDGDFDFDGDVDGDDLGNVPNLPGPGSDTTCRAANGTGSGTACASNADCTVSGETCHAIKSRYLSVVANSGVVAGGGTTTIQVEIVSLLQCAGGVNVGRGCEIGFPGQCPTSSCISSPRVGEIWWAGPEVSLPNSPQPPLRGAGLVCTLTPSAQLWTPGNIYLFGPPVAPGASYNVRLCDAAGANCADPVLFATGEWGDVVLPFGGISQPNFNDVNEVIFKFRDLGSSLDIPRVDLVGVGNPGFPNTPNRVANFADIAAAIEGFRGIGYVFTVPACQ